MFLRDSFLGGIPLQVFPFAIGRDRHLARHHAVVAQHVVALDGFVCSNRVEQIAVVQLKGLGAGLYVRDGFGHVLGGLTYRSPWMTPTAPSDRPDSQAAR